MECPARKRCVVLNVGYQVLVLGFDVSLKECKHLPPHTEQSNIHNACFLIQLSCMEAISPLGW